MSSNIVRIAGLLSVFMSITIRAGADEEAPVPITDQPWQEVVVSVTNLDRTARFFGLIGGYEEKWRGALTPAEIAFWGLDRSASAEALLLGPRGRDSGLVRLVRFDGVGRKEPTRPGARAWDTGCYFSLNVHTRGIQSIYDDAISMGWWSETPITATQVGDSTRNAVVFRGPDGVQVLAIESPGVLPEGERFSEPFSVLQTVRDRDTAYQFFSRILGFFTLRHDELSGAQEAGLTPFGIPRTPATNAAFGASEVYSQSRETGRVEILEISAIDGRDLSARCAAPNLGVLALRYPVASTKDALYDIAGRGGRLELFASGVTIEPYGNVRLFNVKTPDGANVHFYETLDRLDDAVESEAGAHGP